MSQLLNYFKRSIAAITEWQLSKKENTDLLIYLTQLDPAIISYIKENNLSLNVLLEDGETVMTKAIKIANNQLDVKKDIYDGFVEQNSNTLNTIQFLEDIEHRNKRALVHLASKELLEKLQIPKIKWPLFITTKLMFEDVLEKATEANKNFSSMTNAQDFLVLLHNFQPIQECISNITDEKPLELAKINVDLHAQYSEEYIQTDILKTEAKKYKQHLSETVTARELIEWLSHETLRNCFEWTKNYKPDGNTFLSTFNPDWFETEKKLKDFSSSLPFLKRILPYDDSSDDDFEPEMIIEYKFQKEDENYYADKKKKEIEEQERQSRQDKLLEIEHLQSLGYFKWQPKQMTPELDLLFALAVKEREMKITLERAQRKQEFIKEMNLAKEKNKDRDISRNRYPGLDMEMGR